MRFRRVRLSATDPAAATRFYAEALGLGERDGSLRCGDGLLEFFPAAPGVVPIHHIAFGVPENRFDEAKAWLAGRSPLLADGERDEFDFRFWDARACYTFDAAGNVLELIAHAGLGTEAPRFTGAADITGIAEVGLPAGDVLGLVEVLGGLGLGTWDGDPPDARFSAIGARGATFIIVPAERNWYPTESPSGLWPIEVEISGGITEPLDRPLGLPYRIIPAA